MSIEHQESDVTWNVTPVPERNPVLSQTALEVQAFLEEAQREHPETLSKTIATYSELWHLPADERNTILERFLPKPTETTVTTHEMIDEGPTCDCDCVVCDSGGGTHCHSERRGCYR